MAAAGAPLRAIQEWMGHADYKTTSIYAHYAPDPTKGAVWAEAALGMSENESSAAPARILSWHSMSMRSLASSPS